MSKTIRILTAAFFTFSVLFITSCENTLTITFTNEETRISYSGKPGNAFLRTISAISGISGNSEKTQNAKEGKNENAFQDTSSSFFDAEQIRLSMSQAGFENVNASANADNSFSVGFSLPDLQDAKEPHVAGKGKSNPFSASGIFNRGQDGKPYLEISSEKLQSLYEKLPSEIQSYLDMLIAPSFTGEKMPDEEYLDLLASVYGQSLADEIKNSKINFVFVEKNAGGTDNANSTKNAGGKNAKRARTTISLLSVLNTEGKITITAK